MQCDDGYVPWTSWCGLGFWVRSRTLLLFGLFDVAGWSSWRRPFLPPHLLGCGFWFDLFLLRFQKFLTLNPSLHFPMVVKLNLLSNSKTLHEVDEGFHGRDGWLLWLFLGFLLPVEWFDLGALLKLQSEGKFLLLPIDIELNFSSSHIDVCIRRT